MYRAHGILKSHAAPVLGHYPDRVYASSRRGLHKSCRTEHEQDAGKLGFDVL